MATVTSFDGLVRPSKSELRQFAELFRPLFLASTDEAKRQAVAALSQCPHVPAAVALFIGSQPIGIAAPFLAGSQIIDDDTLITIARSQGAAHIKAIVRRENLSPKVIDALVGLRQIEPRRETVADAPPVAFEASPVVLAPSLAPETASVTREEGLRREIKQMAADLAAREDDRLGLRSLSETQAALLVRFAREREASHFASTLADALSASRWLAERILLDMSGLQLATTLTSLGTDFLDAAFMLERFYPQLAEIRGSVSRAWQVLDDLDPAECDARVEAWRRADSYTYLPPETGVPAATGEQHAADPRTARQMPPAREMKVLARAFGGAR